MDGRRILTGKLHLGQYEEPKVSNLVGTDQAEDLALEPTRYGYGVDAAWCMLQNHQLQSTAWPPPRAMGGTFRLQRIKDSR